MKHLCNGLKSNKKIRKLDLSQVEEENSSGFTFFNSKYYDENSIKCILKSLEYNKTITNLDIRCNNKLYMNYLNKMLSMNRRLSIYEIED